MSFPKRTGVSKEVVERETEAPGRAQMALSGFRKEEKVQRTDVSPTRHRKS